MMHYYTSLMSTAEMLLKFNLFPVNNFSDYFMLHDPEM